MNKKFTSHLIWAAVAITAFVIGSQLDRESASEKQASKTNSPALSSRQSSADSTSKGTTSRTKSARAIGDLEKQSTILSDADIAELGQEFRLAKGPIARRLAFSEMLKNLTPENARLMRENIAHMSQDSPEFREFHYAWGSLAGEEAIVNGKDTPKRDMASALAGWAAADPASAMAYFDSLSPEQQSNASHMKWGAAFGLADADPQLAAEFAAERFAAGDKEAGKMIHIAASAVLRSDDRELATDWANKIPEGDLQNQAFQRLGSEYARKDPSDAVAWAVDLPEGEGKSHAIGSSFHHWAGRSPEEAAAAIDSVPADQRDAAKYGFATRAVHDNPEVGVEWAANIQNPEARNSALVDTGRVFYRRNPEAAREWLATANLSEESVQKITGGK